MAEPPKLSPENEQFMACPCCTIQIPVGTRICPHCRLEVPESARQDAEKALVKVLRMKKKEEGRPLTFPDL